MRKNLKILTYLLLTMFVIPELIAQDGSSCENAIPAVVGTNTADNSNGDQWFKYTVQHSGKVLKISTCGLTNEDTNLKLYKGDCNNLVFVSGSDDYCNYQSQNTILADSGVTYYICWRNSYTNGTYTWTLEENNAVAGQLCSTAITAVAGTNIADNSNGDQWFKYTVQHRGKVLKISTCGLTNEDTYLILYKGDCNNLEYIAENDQFCGDQSQIRIPVDSGQTYFIRWSEDYTNASYSWILQEVDPEPGEICSTAITAIADTNIADNSNGDQWFKYTVQQSGKALKISTCDLTNADTYVELYKGDCNNLEYIEESDQFCGGQSKIIVPVDSGQTYYIRWRSYYTSASYPWILQEVDPEPGEICSTAITAVAGTNIADNSNGDQWFKYTVQHSGKVLKISTCGLTNEDTYVNIYQGDCDYLWWLGYSNNDCLLQSRIAIPADSGQTYYILWRSTYTQASYPWILQEVDPEPGEVCSTAITAKMGTNESNHNASNYQWFKYTATTNDTVIINSCDLTLKWHDLIIYTGNCNSLSYFPYLNQCSGNIKIEFKVDSGITYYFRWSSVHADSYPWQLFIKNQAPTDVYLSGPTGICLSNENQQFTYTVGGGLNATEFVWLLPGGIKETTKTNTYTLYTNDINSDSVTIGVYAYNIYGTTDTAFITTRFIQNPEKPTITRSGNILTSSAANGNQWYGNFGAIAGAVNNTYTVTQDGQYYVVVNNNGCLSEPSDVIEVILTAAAQETVNGGIQIYPNPVGNKLYIQSDFGDGIIINYEIYNTAGTRIMSGKFTGNTSIDVTKLTRGVYSLQFISEKGNAHLKFIKQ